MTAPDPLFLLQYLQTKDSRLYDFLRFLLRRIDNLQYQINNLPAPTSAVTPPAPPGAAISGNGSLNFGAGDTTLSGTIADARITGSEVIVCTPSDLGLSGHTNSPEDYALEEIHIIVTSVSAGQFTYVAHAPYRITGRVGFNWIGVA